MKKLLISAENAEFQIIESLKTNRSRRAKNREIFIEGIESIKQVFKSGFEISRIITTDRRSSWAEGIIEQYGSSVNPGPKIIEMSDDLYRKLCDRNDPSEMLVTAKIPETSERSLKAAVGSQQAADGSMSIDPFILVLDRPSDTGNLGSIIRSANAFGIDRVLLIGHGVDPWDPKTIRASLGSIFFTVPLQLDSLNELNEYIAELKARCSLKVWGTDSQGSSSLTGTILKRPLVLILGNEARGMSVALKALCDGIISIPVSGTVNSLNLACAAGIFMWEVYENSG
ncbi:MAG: RNA methyltransferase [Treponema sp.]|nr:RNA methyltransferase [Treponema sp.]